MSDNQQSNPLAGVPGELIERFRLDAIDFDRPAKATTDLLRLDGKTALVTGAGGDGSGNAICHRLAEQGAAVGALDINEDAARATADAIAGRWGVKTATATANAADPAEVEAAVATIEAELGGIDILVNNVGGSGAIGGSGGRVSPPGSPFVEMRMEDLEIVVGVNLVSTLLATKAVLSGMIERGFGKIINISSDAGRMSAPGLAVYAAAKAGVIAFTQNLAVEVGRQGITTVAVCPGTMLNGRTLANIAVPKVTAMVEDYYEAATIGRFSVPDEVASAVAYLASEAASYVHGTVISVSGGQAGR